MSNQTNDVFDMIHDDENNAKIDAEKWAAIGDPRSPPPPPPRENDDDRVVANGIPVRRVVPRLSTPGAYRVGDTESDYGGQTIGGGASDDDDSESCLMVVPKAALVDDEEKDGVMMKDVEAPSSKVPIVKARSFPDALHSAPAKKKSTHKRKFRCCMILLCLLLSGLLGGVLYFLGKDEFGNSTSLEPANDNGNGNDDGNNDGNNNDGRRPSRGGDGGGGNGRDNNNN